MFWNAGREMEKETRLMGDCSIGQKKYRQEQLVPVWLRYLDCCLDFDPNMAWHINLAFSHLSFSSVA